MTAAAGLECPAYGLVTAVRVGTGAADLYPARSAFAAVLIVYTVFNIAADAADLILFHLYHSFSSCENSFCGTMADITGNIYQ